MAYRMAAQHPLENWLGRSDDAILHLDNSEAQRDFLSRAASAWAGLRAFSRDLNKGLSGNDSYALVLQHLQELRRNRLFLFVAESDVRLLLLLLGGPGRGAGSNEVEDATLSHRQPLKCLGIEVQKEAEECCLLLLSCWGHRSGRPARGAPFTESTGLFASAVSTVAKLLEESGHKSRAAGILFLGISCTATSCSPDVRQLSLRSITTVLTTEALVTEWERWPELLAGVGYAMSACHDQQLESLFSAMLSVPFKGSESPPLAVGLLLHRLLEYEGTRLRTYVQAPNPTIQAQTAADLLTISGVCIKSLSVDQAATRDIQSHFPPPFPVRCMAAMAAGGLLYGLCCGLDRSSREMLVVSGLEQLSITWEGQVSILEEALMQAALEACPWEIPTLRTSDPGPALKAGFLKDQARQLAPWIPPALSWACSAQPNSGNGFWALEEAVQVAEARHWLRYVAVSIGKLYSGGGPGLPPHPAILWCLSAVLLGDILQLGSFHAAVVEDLFRAGVEQPVDAGAHPLLMTPGLTERAALAVQDRVHSLWFKEVGAVARALCEQAQRAPEEMQAALAHCILSFSKALQTGERIHHFAPASSWSAPVGRFSTAVEEDIPATKQILQASFLTVCLTLSKLLPAESEGGRVGTPEAAPGDSLLVDLLETLALLEFCRVGLEAYPSLVKSAVTLVMTSSTAQQQLVARLPSYVDLTTGPEVWQRSGRAYNWMKDSVQSSSMHFFMRVLPPGLAHLPPQLFTDRVAPPMYLYLHHPEKDVATSAHALFGAFLAADVASAGASVGGQSNAEADMFKEQLSLYYMKRSLSGYPGLVPFDAFVGVVGAIVRHLPPGSPAVMVCLGRLAARVLELHRAELSCQNSELREEEGEAVAGQGAHAAQRAGKRIEETDATQGADPLERKDGAERLQLVLLHVIPLVDLQILHLVLYQVGRLVLSIPGDRQLQALTDLFAVVSTNDDYTRKPQMVQFYQALVFLCSGRTAGTQRDAELRKIVTGVHGTGNSVSLGSGEIISNGSGSDAEATANESSPEMRIADLDETGNCKSVNLNPSSAQLLLSANKRRFGHEREAEHGYGYRS